MFQKTLKVGVWGGRVVFHMRPFTYAVTLESKEFMTLLKEMDAQIVEDMPGVKDVADLLSATPKIEFFFEGDENPPLEDLKEFWEAYEAEQDRRKRICLAVEWRKVATAEVIIGWMKAMNEAANPIRIPAQLPENLLTQEEQAQLEDPNSFLAESVEASGSDT